MLAPPALSTLELHTTTVPTLGVHKRGVTLVNGVLTLDGVEIFPIFGSSGGPETNGQIAPHHLEMLAASGIPPEHAEARGYETITDPRRLAELGIVKSARGCVPGLLVPMLRTEGSTWGYQYRADGPRLRGGKPVKYETRWQQRNGLDVPPGVGDYLGDPTVPLWITEGVKKADCGAQHGLCIVALTGVWGWRGTNDVGGRTVIADLNEVALNDRRVILAFDGDVARNPKAAKGLCELAEFLKYRGASVEYLHLPDTKPKTGLDDYLVDGHTAEDLWKLVRPNPPPIPDEDYIDADYVEEPEAEPAVTDFTCAGARCVSQVVGCGLRHRRVQRRARHSRSGEIRRRQRPYLAAGGERVGQRQDRDRAGLRRGRSDRHQLHLQRRRAAECDAQEGARQGCHRRAVAPHRRARGAGRQGRLDHPVDGPHPAREGARGAAGGLRRPLDAGGRQLGGNTLSWRGRIAVIGAVTTAWDTPHAVVATMGDRFVLLRIDSTTSSGPQAGRKAIANIGYETEMRAELADAVGGVIAGMSAEPITLTATETDVLLAAANLATHARTGVETTTGATSSTRTRRRCPPGSPNSSARWCVGRSRSG